MASSPKMTKQDEEWKAESDANTLADAAAIQADNKRMTKARVAAKKMADEAMAKAQRMASLAKKRAPRKRPTPKRRARR